MATPKLTGNGVRGLRQCPMSLSKLFSTFVQPRVLLWGRAGAEARLSGAFHSDSFKVWIYSYILILEGWSERDFTAVALLWAYHVKN